MASKGGKGKRRVPMVKISDKNSLLRTFIKRHKTLIAKSEQLSVLCGIRVAVSIQSPQSTGTFIEAAFDGESSTSSSSSSSSSSSMMMMIAEEEAAALRFDEGGKGRRKKIERIARKESLNVTFSKRRRGLLKLAEELSVLCGVHVALSVRSPGGKLVEKTFHGGGDNIDDDDRPQQHRVLVTTPNCDHKVPSLLSSSSLEHRQQPQQRDNIIDIDSDNEFIDGGGITYLSLDEMIEEIVGLEEQLMEVGEPHHDDYAAAAASSSSSSSSGLRDIGWSSDDLVYLDEITRAFADSCFSSLIDCCY